MTCPICQHEGHDDQLDLCSRARDETYLGDGLYARFDGYQIVLRAPRSEGDHVVALEPEVYLALVRFGSKWWKVPEP